MSTKTYIHLDSTYRNRNEYPLPSYFCVPISQNNNGQVITAVNAADPVSLAFPQYSFSGQSIVVPPATFNGGTNTNPQLNILASNIDNYYNGYNITDTTIGQTRKIVGYVGTSHIVTLDSPFSNTWAATDTYLFSDPSTSSIIQLQPGASLVDNAYTGKYIRDETIGQTRTIVSYSGNTRTATLSSAFSGGWVINNSYTIRESTIDEEGLIVAVTSNSVTLSPISSSEDDYYKGKFVYFSSGPLVGESRIIISYNGTTKEATLNKYFSVLPIPGNIYQILPLSYDNVTPLQYSGSILSQQETINYEVQLISLQVPNKVLVTSPGSRLSYYPYIFVELSNDTAPSVSKHCIYSNNPNANKALFVVPIDDIQDPTTSQFLSLSCDMVQTMRFKPNDNLRFSVFLPNGVLFNIGPDNYSPLPSDPTIQIMAVFSIRRLS